MLKKNHYHIIIFAFFAVCMLSSISCSPVRIQLKPALPSGKKEIPQITFKNLSPPYKDYNYLQDSRKYGFRYNETSFNLINAWWLAEVSMLVYADEDFVKPVFKKAGLTEVKFFQNQSTQCYVASNDKFAIVAFRGSETWKKRDKADLRQVFADLKTDLDIWLTNWEQGGKVHRGFKKALDEVWPDLLPYVRKLQDNGRKIWVTGHSLGGALATLFTSRYGNVQGVYTFGSPRVGNAVFRENFNINMYRFVNNHDIVPLLPLTDKYVQIGEPKFIDGEGIIGGTKTKIENERPVDDSKKDPHGLEDTNKSENSSLNEFVPAFIRDHVPLLYTIYIWNNIIESQNNKN